MYSSDQIFSILLTPDIGFAFWELCGAWRTCCSAPKYEKSSRAICLVKPVTKQELLKPAIEHSHIHYIIHRYSFAT